MKLGFIGLGAMGAPMATNLLEAGHELAVWNRSPERADPLVEAGARPETIFTTPLRGTHPSGTVRVGKLVDETLQTEIEGLFRPGGVDKVTMPVTLVAAGEDSVVLTRGAKAMAARLPNGRYVEIPGAYHEILQEQDHIRAIFWSEFDRLALKVVAASSRPA